MITTPPNINPEDDRNGDDIQKISTFRRVLPQIFGTCAKNLMILNLGEFAGFPSIVIPSLIGISNELNPDETLQMTAAQTSWLSSLAHVAHPIGSLLSGPINDRIGRRNAIMLVCIPLAFAWLMLGFSYSFPIICIGFTLIGFSFGLKEAPSYTYITEISEPSMRGMMMAIALLCYNIGVFIVLGFGSMFSWRQVSLIFSLFPIVCLIAMFMVPESPSWLISKRRFKDAQQSLQWLRGWVPPRTIQNEFTSLQEFNGSSDPCATCSKQSFNCNHRKSTFLDKIKELKQKRNLKPCLLMFCLQFFNEFCGFTVWQPYMIQVLNALGTPINPNLVAVIGSGLGILASIFLISTVKIFGKRRIYLSSSGIVAICCFGLSIYGFILLPSGWMSFKEFPNDFSKSPEFVRNFVGNYSYIALALVLIMQFCAKIGIAGMPIMLVGEVFPFKSRSLLCGIATANHYILASIATKTYYNVEAVLSLPGAILFYGWVSVFGFIVMFLILPETEERSLEDIELHYSDNSKSVTDIYINKRSKTLE